MTWSDLQKLTPKVHSILEDNPQTRDDDRLLIVEVWAKESRAYSKREFLVEILKGHIAFPDAVTRVRRKLQEKHEHLRGEKWEIRHKMQGDVCEQIELI